MARMPGARWQGEHGSREMVRYDGVCLHTIVGYAPAHAAHFSVKADGTILQSRDTRYRSAANLNGNHRIIAIENEDHGPAFGRWNVKDGHAVPDFTAAQIEANAQILAWAHKTHGVPLQLMPNSRPTSRGLAYHRQGVDGNFDDYDFPGRVSGGETWTESDGKVCPGDKRIARRQQILNRAKRIVAGTPPTPAPTEDFMGFIDNQDDFNTAMARALEVILEPKDLTQNKPIHKALAWLRAAPWHQDMGRSGKNFHAVVGEIHAAVTSALPKLVREAGDEIGLTPEQTEQLATSVASKVERVTVVVED